MNNNLIKPFLPKDVDPSRLNFPLWGLAALCKIDGSFAFVQNGKLYARSLKQHENIYTTNLYSNPDFEGLRGELISGNNPTAEGLCRTTSGDIRRIEGEPETSLWCFDFVTHETKNLPYKERYELLHNKVIELNSLGYKNINIIPMHIVHNEKEYLELRDFFLSQGYEGLVLRDPQFPHKEGRSSATKPQLWRYKPYATAEILVTHLLEGTTNLNEATKNELGRSTRSSHKENLQNNATVGTIVGTLVNELTDYSGKVIAIKGTEINVSPGEMKGPERKFYWENQSEIVGHIVEFSYMSYGLKDKPRFANFTNFKRIRSERDM